MAKIKSKMIVAITLGTITLFLAVGLWVFYFTSVDAKVVVRANKITNIAGATNTNLGRDLSKELKLEYALDGTQRENGLMRRQSLCENCGMFFVFDNTQPLTFWMKNTLIPLDIIFITKDGVVTNIEQAASEPNSKDETQYPTYSSKEGAIYVLEVNQGWTEKNQLKTGDKINIPNLLPKNN